MSRIFMRCVGDNHILVLDLETDASHLVNMDDEEKALFTFNSSTRGYTPDGKTVCHIRLTDNQWVCDNDLGIECTPVSFNKVEGVFDIEAEFCAKWLEYSQKASHVT